MREVTIGPNEAGQRFDKYLKKYLREAGSGFLYKMLRKKNITLNGGRADGGEKLSEGDVVRFFLAEETLEKFRGSLPPEMGKDLPPDQKKASEGCPEIPVLYEDKHILLANKPAGLLTQKAVPEDYSLNEWLVDYLLESGQLTSGQLRTFRPSVCNRLDRNTSGLVICGKSLAGSQKMSELLRDRSLHKYYRFYAAGKPGREGITESWLVKDEKSNQVYIFPEKPDSPRAVQIRTGLKVLFRSRDCFYGEVELFTGKTHQIRAQMAAMGNPLIGDGKYGDRKINEQFRRKGIHSQLLHACRLEFPPMEGEFSGLSGCVFRAPEPETFTKMKQLLEQRE